MFPDKYESSIVLAEHGSWDRARKDGYRVMLAQLDGQQDRLVRATGEGLAQRADRPGVG
jgi:glucose/arabinose dehydrogenase